MSLWVSNGISSWGKYADNLILTAIAAGLFNTLDSMATPCSAAMAYILYPRLEVAI